MDANAEGREPRTQPRPGCQTPPERVILVRGVRFTHLEGPAGRRVNISWKLDQWRWGMFTLSEDDPVTNYVRSYETIVKTVHAAGGPAEESGGSVCVQAVPAVWSAATQAAEGRKPWMGERYTEIWETGVCLHPPEVGAVAQPGSGRRNQLGEQGLLAAVAQGRVPSPYGPGWRPAPEETRTVYVDASISRERDRATYGIVTSDGIETAGELDIPENIPAQLTVDWSELAAATIAVEAVTRPEDGRWASVPAENTVLYSDNSICAGFAAGALKVGREDQPEVQAEFHRTARLILESELAWVGVEHPGERHPYLSWKADQLAFGLRRPDVDSDREPPPGVADSRTAEN